MSKRVRKRLAERDVVLFNHEQVAAALYMATGGLIDLWGECRACKAHGRTDLCIECGGSGRVPS